MVSRSEGQEVLNSSRESEWIMKNAFFSKPYVGIDLEAIWEISQRDIPQLKQAVQSMLQTGQE